MEKRTSHKKKLAPYKKGKSAVVKPWYIPVVKHILVGLAIIIGVTLAFLIAIFSGNQCQR